MNYYERIQESIDYIEENMFDTVQLEEISKRAYMSLAVFYRIFFAIVGYTPKEYIRRRRISMACQMLRDTDIKVIDAALFCGYQSVDAYSRAFRGITGFLPEQFKKKIRHLILEG